MKKRVFSAVLALCIVLMGALPVGAASASRSLTPLTFKTHGLELPITASPNAPSAILTDYDEWYAFASGFDGVDAACFQMRGSFDNRALLAVPLCEDGYVSHVETDDTTVYVTCTTVGAINSAQRYLLVEVDPAAVQGKTLSINTVSSRATPFLTENAVTCRGDTENTDARVYTSRNELRALAATNYSGQELETIDGLAGFDDAFFENNVLVYTALYTPSTGYELTLATFGLVTDDAIVVRRNKVVPPYHDVTLSVIGCYAYLIPVPRSLYNGQDVTVMDETACVRAAYPQGSPVTCDLLYRTCVTLSTAVEPFGTIIRTYDEWRAAVAADTALGDRYDRTVTEEYFDEHAVALLHTMEYFPIDKGRVVEVLRQDNVLTVVTEWGVPDMFYPCYQHERIVLGLAKEDADGVDTVARHDVQYPSVQKGLYAYDLFPDGTIRLTSCSDPSDTLVIPQTIDGYEVSAIGESCFLRNSTAQTVVLPASVDVIEASAFQESRIKQVFLPEGLETIESHAFFACTGLERLVIPSTVTSIGERAIGFGYYTDPAYPDLIPGSVGVRETFTLIADRNAVAEAYADATGVACRTPADFPLGDTDFSGTVDASDGRLLLAYVLNGYTRTWSVSDVSGNGTADTTDVRLLLSGLVQR